MFEQAKANRARLDAKWAAEKARRAEQGPYVMLAGFAILGLALAAIIGLGWWGVSTLRGGDEPELQPVTAAPATPTVNRMEEKRLSTINVGCNVAEGLRDDIATMNEDSLDIGWNMQAFMEPYDALLQAYANQSVAAMRDFEGTATNPSGYAVEIEPILLWLDRYQERCVELLP